MFSSAKSSIAYALVVLHKLSPTLYTIVSDLILSYTTDLRAPRLAELRRGDRASLPLDDHVDDVAVKLDLGQRVVFARYDLAAMMVQVALELRPAEELLRHLLALLHRPDANVVDHLKMRSDKTI